ncbi:hypothetical protein HPB52_023527 [Rhipicephalus sanguineus]|uniref:Uncharacterized protein n=1 Tax=Rhipicephalus sanguineus TaxID=34632 RepID=A0A9D4TC09_RHISA|nr:hypothetical protein HPB52_023527 [Rhipicephalus sanguineus]
MDLLPTIAELARITLPPGLVLDGQSLVDSMLGRNETPSESVDSSEYREKIGPILEIYQKHRCSLVPGKPQLDWCDDAAMQWAPPGCEKIDRCLPVPPSRPYRCPWPY